MIKHRDSKQLYTSEAMRMAAHADWKSVRLKLNVCGFDDFKSSNIRKVFDAHAPKINKKVTKKIILG